MRVTDRLLIAFLFGVTTWPACGGGSDSPSSPNPTPVPTPIPTPTPVPTPIVPVPCQLTAPTIDCSTRPFKHQEMADVLQAASDTAMGTAGVMYSGENRIYDLAHYRSIVVDYLAKKGVCGAWDYGNEKGDEIYLRSADGCKTEQYDLITGEGGVRNAGKGSNAWEAGFEEPVPGPKPNWPKEGDLQCSLPGDKSTFCFTIKGTHGAFGDDIYKVFVAVLNENPQLFDKNETAPGQGNEFVPDELRLPAWRIVDQDGYILAVETKLRSSGYCGYIEKGDILKAKKVAMGNIFHEEMDVVQNPPVGGSFVSFVVKDRCHDAGF
jgi:hypothetical protein